MRRKASLIGIRWTMIRRYKANPEISLVVQNTGTPCSQCKGLRCVIDQGTKIPRVVQQKRKKKKKKCIHSKIWPDKDYLAALQSQGDGSLRVILWAPTPVMDHSEDFIDRKREILGSLESCGQDVVSFPQKTHFSCLYTHQLYSYPTHLLYQCSISHCTLQGMFLSGVTPEIYSKRRCTKFHFLQDISCSGRNVYRPLELR